MFVVVLLLGYAGHLAIGQVYGAAEAIALIDALSRAGLYLASAIVTASATTMALMLTLIGMMRRMDEEFDARTYRRVDNIAVCSVASLLCGVFLLMAFVLPTGEFESMPASWFSQLYQILFAVTVVMTAIFAATVVLIYTTLRRVIAKITPGDLV